MACTERASVGFLVGHYYSLVGDSASGKTWIGHTTLAEAAINPKFDDYRLIYDDAEGGALMDILKYFGQKLVDRIEPPAGTKDEPVYSETVEQFYDLVDDAVEEGTPFIYILDSMDAVDTEDDTKKIKKMKDARKKGRSDKETGTYGTAKAKINSNRLRGLMIQLKKTNSILIILSQTRDNMGFGFEQKTRSGGKALKFYATLEIWMSVKEKLRRKVKETNMPIGIVAKAQIKKNRIKGKDRIALIPIYYSVGIDDVGGNITWLVSAGYWKGTKTKVDAPEFEYRGTIEGLVQKIEEENLEKDLQKFMSKCWQDLEDKCTINRKSRYQ